MGVGIRQTVTDNYLSPATTLDANADYTLMGWFRFASFEGVYTVPLGLSSGDATRYDSFYFYPGWRAVESIAGEGYETDGDEETPALDTWTHLALVREGTSVSLWIDGAQAFTVALDVSEADPVTMLLIGGALSDHYSVLGDITACRAWTAALDSTEIAAEKASAAAVRSSALWADWRMAGADESARLQDSSGNGRHLTRYGDATETFEDGPLTSGPDELSAVGVTTGAPTVGSPAIGQAHALTAQGVATGAPTVGAPALTQAHVLAAQGIATGTPALGAPTLTQAHALAATGIATGAPTLGSPTLRQVHHLSPVGVSAGAPEFGPVTLAQVHALLAVGVTAGAPTLDRPALNGVWAALPAERSRIVALENRFGTVDAETRLLIVAAESRTRRV